MKILISLVCFILSLGLWCGLFFGLELKEVLEHTKYEPALCTTVHRQVLQNYCCEKKCTYCSDAFSFAPSCRSTMASDNALDVLACKHGKGKCPTVGSCNNGYHCCHTCCQTCRSCHTSCDSKGHCHESCHSYDCNCYCCISTYRHECTITCPVCWSVKLDVLVQRLSPEGFLVGQPYPSTYTQKFKKNEYEAHQFYNEHPEHGNMDCFAEIKGKGVILERHYTSWKWGLTGTASILFLFSFMGVHYSLLDEIILYNSATRNMIIVITTWFGILVPFAIFLPIYLLGIMDEGPRTTVFVFLCIFFALGFTPLATVGVSRKTYSDKKMLFFLCFIGLIVPVTVLLPLIVRGEFDRQIQIVLASIGGALLVFYLISLLYILKKKRDADLYYEYEPLLRPVSNYTSSSYRSSPPVSGYASLNGGPRPSADEIFSQLQGGTSTETPVAAADLSITDSKEENLPAYHNTYTKDEEEVQEHRHSNLLSRFVDDNEPSLERAPLESQLNINSSHIAPPSLLTTPTAPSSFLTTSSLLSSPSPSPSPSPYSPSASSSETSSSASPSISEPPSLVTHIEPIENDDDSPPEYTVE